MLALSACAPHEAPASDDLWGRPWAQSYAEPDEAKILSSLRRNHPRLIVLDGDLARIRSNAEKDPIARGYYDALRQNGDRMLTQPLPERVLVGPRLLAVSRTVLGRVYTLALLHRLTHQDAYLRRAVDEMRAAASFSDWNPSHFLDVAEMTHALAIGYDWLYGSLTPAERTLIRQAIVDKGLLPAKQAYEKQVHWTSDRNNWNNVCSGGIAVGALAVADEEPALSSWLLYRNVTHVTTALASYAPDGAWEEGPGYWNYATTYSVAMFSALQTALGTDFGLSASAGLAEAGTFRLHSVGPGRLFFNYADAGESAGDEPNLFWLARRYQRPVLAFAARAAAGVSGSYGDLIWYDGSGSEADLTAVPRDARFSRVHVATLRSAWADANAWYVGFKAGDNHAGHSHLDLGSFVLDAEGQRWAIDLGPDDYNLPGYFGAQRYSYYRLGTSGHNTLLIDDRNQESRAVAPITAFATRPAEAFAVADLTGAYAPTGVTRAARGIALLEGRGRVLVQDEIEAGSPVEVVWAMHTRAAVTLGSRTATLTQGGRTLEVRVLEPAGARLSVDEVSLAAPQKPLSNVRRLQVRLPERTTSARIAVLIAPPGAAAPAITPLPAWPAAGPQGKLGREGRD